MNAKHAAQVLIVGSGAGGAITALTLARAGLDVLILEEGLEHDLSSYGKPAPEAMVQLYRRRGMTPILGKVPIGYVEGACLGGSTEINSGFWHRTPRETLLDFKSRFGLSGASEEELKPHFDALEELLGVGTYTAPWPNSTQLFARGVERMGWSYQEVPRAAPGCQSTNACAQGCPTGAKQGMSQRIIPEARKAGARVLTGVRVLQLLHRRGRVYGVVGAIRQDDGSVHLVRIEAEHVFVCAGPTETPALLQKSGIKYHVGNTLRIHPYLKVAARFAEPVDSGKSVLPLIQVKEFWPELSLGGAFYSPGQLAMTLSENWPANAGLMQDAANFAQYYVGVRGSGAGSVRPAVFGRDSTLIRYELSNDDTRGLSVGLARIAEVLLAAGALEVYPSVWGLEPIRRPEDAARWLHEPLNKQALSLVTVHAFSSCPIGERRELCAADSYGRVFDFDNLRIADASMLPDSPGVNPQGSVMALARRNAQEFAASLRA